MNLDCMLKSISTFLNDNQITLGSVSFNTNMFGVASICSNGNLTFAGSWAIDSEYLSHEWFHVGQRKMNNADFTDGYVEFEAWLFFDIKETIRVSGDFDASNHEFACYKRSVGVGVYQPYKRDYQNWLMTITNNGTTYPTKNTMGFYNFGPNFAETRRYTHLSFGNTSYSPNTMFNLINNCK